MRWDWLITNQDKVIQLALDHLLLVLPVLVVSVLVAVPIGWVAHRYTRLREVLVTLTGALYVIPSLALFILLPLVIGTSILSPVNVIVAMSLYGVALLVRSSTDAFDTVPADVKNAATAIGFSPLRRVWGVELPLAGPGIIAGLRVVSASTISLVSVGALVGVHSLGTLFTEGFQRSFPTEIIVGIGGTLALAIVMDLIIVFLGWALLPWSRKVGS